MARQRLKDILRSLFYFSNNAKSEKNNKGFKICPVIDHFNNSFSNAISNDELQSIDDHMVKFKVCSSIKQYVKKKPIKCGFKVWYRCARTTCYLYQLELYLGKKDEIELNLGESVELKMCKVLEKNYCIVNFDNFFNIPLLISKLFKKGLYGAGTAQSGRRGMPALPSNKKMKRRDSDYQFSINVACCKWMDNRSLVMLFSNIEGKQTKSSVCFLYLVLMSSNFTTKVWVEWI